MLNLILAFYSFIHLFIRKEEREEIQGNKEPFKPNFLKPPKPNSKTKRKENTPKRKSKQKKSPSRNPDDKEKPESS